MEPPHQDRQRRNEQHQDGSDPQDDNVEGEVNYDLALVTTHESVDELKGYQGHPAHVEFGGWLRPLLTSRVVVDYEV